MKVFVTARSHVAPHLYDDVIPCLQWLKEEVGVDVAVLTNGNAEGLHTCDTLGKYVSLSISATDVGVMKPSPVPFLAVSQRTGVTPDRILFVGDSHDKDVLGAQATGMAAALIARGYGNGDDTSSNDNSNSNRNSGISNSNSGASTQISTDTTNNGGGVTASTDSSIPELVRELLKDDNQIVLSSLMPAEFQKKVEQFLGKRRTSRG